MSGLLETQRWMAAAVMAPRDSAIDASEVLKPNRRMSAGERLEIYRRSYWSRLIDSLTEDFPGLRAVLGRKAFRSMAEQYLLHCPSRSFTLRDLGAQLETWLMANPGIAGDSQQAALDMVRLEWADIHAFDSEERQALGAGDLKKLTPRLRLGLQPYLSLLELHHPVDEIRLSGKRPRTWKPSEIFIAVHRQELTVFYRRLSREEFRLLLALSEGSPIGAAMERAFAGSEIAQTDVPPLLTEWFSNWSKFGWLTQSGRKKK